MTTPRTLLPALLLLVVGWHGPALADPAPDASTPVATVTREAGQADPTDSRERLAWQRVGSPLGLAA